MKEMFSVVQFFTAAGGEPVDEDTFIEWWDVKGGKGGGEGEIDVEEFGWFIGYWAEENRKMPEVILKFDEAIDCIKAREKI